MKATNCCNATKDGLMQLIKPIVFEEGGLL